MAEVILHKFSGLVPDIDPTMVLHLDASVSTSINAGSPINNDPVEDWFDIGVNGNDARQSSLPIRPVYKSSGFGVNSMPYIEFDGATESMRINNIISKLPNSTVITIVESVNTGVTQTIIGSASVAAANQTTGLTHNVRGNKFENFFGNGTLWKRIVTIESLSNATPYILSNTYADGDALTSMEIDGVDATESIASGIGVNIGGTAYITSIGRFGESSIQFFNGKIAEIKIWNRVLLVAELLAETNALKTKYL